MTAPLQIATTRIATDTAGHTGPISQPSPGPEPLPAMLEPAGQLDHLLTGGIHPEALPSMAMHQLERATDSIRGANGGLTPLRNGTQAPGPAGGTAATAITTAATTGAARARSWLGRQVDALRIPRG